MPFCTRLPSRFGCMVACAWLLLPLIVEGSEPRSELHVATLNLAHGRGVAFDQFRVPQEQFQRNIDTIARLIQREKPDVLALQEADAASVWSGNFDHVRRLASVAEYPHVEHGLHFRVDMLNMELRYGTALMAAHALQAIESVRFDAPPLHTKGFVVADIALGGPLVTVTSIHLDSGSAEVRRRQAQKLIAALRERTHPLIVMGDLNSQWENEDDAVRILAAELDLEAYQPENPELATYPSFRPTKRIDWILISSDLEFRDYGVWPDRVSDHLGVAARIRWR